MMTINLEQAAELLKLHPQTVLKVAQCDSLPTAKTGKWKAFIEDDLLNCTRTILSKHRKAKHGTTNPNSVENITTQTG
jgi:hypothetical protein